MHEKFRETSACKVSTKTGSTARLLSAGLLAVASTASHAGNVSLTPVIDTAPKSGEVSFQMIANFGSTTVLGGTVDLGWDGAIIDFKSFVFDAGMAPPRRDTAFDIVDDQSAGLVSIGFSRFAGMLFDTDTVIGTVTFDVVGASGSTLISVTDSVKWGPFFDLEGNPLVTTYSGSQAFVAAPVPLPSMGWLTTLGVAALGSLGRPRKAAAAV